MRPTSGDWMNPESFFVVVDTDSSFVPEICIKGKRTDTLTTLTWLPTSGVRYFFAVMSSANTGTLQEKSARSFLNGVG